jgi:hypothetical protein
VGREARMPPKAKARGPPALACLPGSYTPPAWLCGYQDTYRLVDTGIGTQGRNRPIVQGSHTAASPGRRACDAGARVPVPYLPHLDLPTCWYRGNTGYRCLTYHRLSLTACLSPAVHTDVLQAFNPSGREVAYCPCPPRSPAPDSGSAHPAVRTVRPYARARHENKP